MLMKKINANIKFCMVDLLDGIQKPTWYLFVILTKVSYSYKKINTGFRVPLLKSFRVQLVGSPGRLLETIPSNGVYLDPA